MLEKGASQSTAEAETLREVPGNSAQRRKKRVAEGGRQTQDRDHTVRYIKLIRPKSLLLLKAARSDHPSQLANANIHTNFSKK